VLWSGCGAVLHFQLLIGCGPNLSMDVSAIKKWIVFFIGILAAIILADGLSNLIVAAAGISGWSRFVVSFVLYAALFFAILYVIERVTGIRFFGCGCSDDH
jgi:hypothetical protein